MRKAITVVLALSLVFLAACGEKRRALPEQSFTVASEVVTVSREMIERDLAGVLRGEMEALVAPEVAGRLQAIYVDVGQEVRRGQALARIEGTGYWLSSEAARGQLEAAALQLKQAEDNYNRYLPLHRSGSISEAQWENIANAYEAAKINHEAAQAGYRSAARTAGETTIRAPIAGVVAVRNFDIGSMVGPSYQVFEIVKTDPMKVSIGVSEKDIATVQNGKQVEVTVEAYPDDVFTGVIHSIGVKADARTHAFPVEVRIPNGDGRLKSGMVAHVRLPIRDLGEVLTIPINAAVQLQGVDYVYVVREVAGDEPGPGADEKPRALGQDRRGPGGDEPGPGAGEKPGSAEPTTQLRVEKRAVTLGQVSDDRVVVLEGLEAGEEIVTEGQQFLEDGSRITIPNRPVGGEAAGVER